MSSGSGQTRPAVSARFNVSRTVERARPSRRAISCVDTDADFSRITSRASRIPIRSAGIDPPLGLPKGRSDQANGGARQSRKTPGGIIPLSEAASSGNREAVSSRYRGRDHPGIGGQLRPESACALAQPQLSPRNSSLRLKRSRPTIWRRSSRSPTPPSQTFRNSLAGQNQLRGAASGLGRSRAGPRRVARAGRAAYRAAVVAAALGFEHLQTVLDGQLTRYERG